MLKGKKIILGVTGSIAAYKASEIVSLLKKRGAEVFVIMTEAATKFVQPITFSTLSGNPVITSLFNSNNQVEVKHVSLSNWADLILIAPATANIIGKIANGIADDMLTTTVMASKSKVVFAPAMNKNMLFNHIYQENAKKLITLGYEFIDSEYGLLACGEIGEGRLANVEDIIEKITNILSFKKDFLNKTILITASCTREPIDKVRFISNYSSGKMGFALAKNAQARGAKVILITGPNNLPAIKGINTILINTANEMRAEVFRYFKKTDIVISSAAVSDFRPKAVFPGKIKKNENVKMIIELEKNPDILYELGRKKDGKILVGFAAETENLVQNASNKLKEKNLDLIIANDLLTKGAGFASDENSAKIIGINGIIRELPLMPKSEMAEKILDEILKIK